MGNRQCLVVQEFTELSQGTVAGDWPHCGSLATRGIRQPPDFAQVFISSPWRSWGWRPCCSGHDLKEEVEHCSLWLWPLQLKRDQQKVWPSPWVPQWASLIPIFVWHGLTRLPGHWLSTMVFSSLARLNPSKKKWASVYDDPAELEAKPFSPAP